MIDEAEAPLNVASHIPGTVATYSCERGFELLGPARRQCRENGTWVPDGVPFCGESIYLYIVIYLPVLAIMTYARYRSCPPRKVCAARGSRNVFRSAWGPQSQYNTYNTRAGAPSSRGNRFGVNGRGPFSWASQYLCISNYPRHPRSRTQQSKDLGHRGSP